MREALAEALASRALLQSALDLRNAALDASSTHFMVVDARQEGRPIVYVNRALAIQHGYARPDDLIGRSVAALANGIVQPDVRATVESTIARGETAKAEAEILGRDGRKFWVGFTTTPLRDAQGNITHHVTLGADITQRRQRDTNERELQQQLVTEMRERERMSIELQLAHKLESVGRLAAGLAHEVNTPIQYVGDSARFLQSAFGDLADLFRAYRAAATEAVGSQARESASGRLGAMETTADLKFLCEEIPKAFERLLEGVDRVAGIVRAMKEFAYPDAVEHVSANLVHALTTTLTVTHNEYKYAASITTQFEEVPEVLCNVGELNQVFLILIVNAAHAIEDSGKDASTGRITIGVRSVDATVEISVTDNGCGITPENLSLIFDRFFTTKEVGRGTGQGLAIARSIVVDRHRGQLDVTSTPGVGTTFFVRLPTARLEVGAVT